MEAAKCLARLTSWEKSNHTIAPAFTVCYVKTCPNIPTKGDLTLCDKCLERPMESKYQTRMIHGLLTQPIPTHSKLYGSPWYWEKLFVKGIDSESIDTAWMTAAKQAQARAELFAGPNAYKVQRPSEKDIQMGRTKTQKVTVQTVSDQRDQKVADKDKDKKKPLVIRGGKETKVAEKLPFAPIKKYYQESEKQPVVLETDTYSIKKSELNGVSVLLTENGLVFAMNTAGDAEEMLGRMVEDAFVPL